MINNSNKINFQSLQSKLCHNDQLIVSIPFNSFFSPYLMHKLIICSVHYKEILFIRSLTFISYNIFHKDFCLSAQNKMTKSQIKI
jgi:hypothetical protein